VWCGWKSSGKDICFEVSGLAGIRRRQKESLLYRESMWSWHSAGIRFSGRWKNKGRIAKSREVFGWLQIAPNLGLTIQWIAALLVVLVTSFVSGWVPMGQVGSSNAEEADWKVKICAARNKNAEIMGHSWRVFYFSSAWMERVMPIVLAGGVNYSCISWFSGRALLALFRRLLCGKRLALFRRVNHGRFGSRQSFEVSDKFKLKETWTKSQADWRLFWNEPTDLTREYGSFWSRPS